MRLFLVYATVVLVACGAEVKSSTGDTSEPTDPTTGATTGSATGATTGSTTGATTGSTTGATTGSTTGATTGTTTTGSTTGSTTGGSTSTTSPSTGTVTGPTVTGTGPTAGYRDGTYVGTLHVDIEDIGFVVNYDTCDAPLTLIVEEAAVPQISGTTTCYPQGVLAGQALTVLVEGSIPADPAAEGDAWMNWNTLFMPQDTWRGSFIDAYTLEGAFDGSAVQGSAGFAWNATFSVSR